MGTRLIVTTFVVFSWSCEKYNGRRLNPLEATVFAESSCSAIVCLIQSSTTGYTAANSSGVIAETPMAGERADAVAIPSHKPIAIVLDFINPRRSPRRLWGGLWQACSTMNLTYLKLTRAIIPQSCRLHLFAFALPQPIASGFAGVRLRPLPF